MSRYIDAEKLREAVNQWDMQELYLPVHFLDLIEVIPTADVKEVKHGRWIKDRNFNDDLARCSACHIFSDRQPNYCPNCGAKMDGGVKE